MKLGHLECSRQNGFANDNIQEKKKSKQNTGKEMIRVTMVCQKVWGNQVPLGIKKVKQTDHKD